MPPKTHPPFDHPNDRFPAFIVDGNQPAPAFDWVENEFVSVAPVPPKTQLMGALKPNGSWRYVFLVEQGVVRGVYVEQRFLKPAPKQEGDLSRWAGYWRDDPLEIHLSVKDRKIQMAALRAHFNLSHHWIHGIYDQGKPESSRLTLGFYHSLEESSGKSPFPECRFHLSINGDFLSVKEEKACEDETFKVRMLGGYYERVPSETPANLADGKVFPRTKSCQGMGQCHTPGKISVY